MASGTRREATSTPLRWAVWQRASPSRELAVIAWTTSLDGTWAARGGVSLPLRWPSPPALRSRHTDTSNLPDSRQSASRVLPRIDAPTPRFATRSKSGASRCQASGEPGERLGWQWTPRVAIGREDCASGHRRFVQHEDTAEVHVVGVEVACVSQAAACKECVVLMVGVRLEQPRRCGEALLRYWWPAGGDHQRIGQVTRQLAHFGGDDAG